MKPENLLIFKNFNVKLGDFGISIKLPDNSYPDLEIPMIKGYTNDYISEKIKDNIKRGESFKVMDLIENDYYALRVTFDKVY